MSIRIAGKLPRDNGLDRLEPDLVEDPAQAVYAIVILSATKITENLDDEDDPHTVTLGIDSVEAVGDDQAAEQLAAMLRHAHQRRTGRVSLFDPITGEVVEEPDA